MNRRGFFGLLAGAVGGVAVTNAASSARNTPEPLSLAPANPAVLGYWRVRPGQGMDATGEAEWAPAHTRSLTTPYADTYFLVPRRT